MKVAIVGATGVVGQTFLKLIEERKFPVHQLKLFASEKNKGRTLQFLNQNLPLETLKEGSFDDINVAFFSAGEHISQQWAKKAQKAGAVVIDNSAVFRMEPDIPLVVPEINLFCKRQKNSGMIIANPNCSTIQLVIALHPLHLAFELEQVSVSSYQSLSGAGQSALNQLREDSLRILNNQDPVESSKSSYAFNCVPQIGSMNEDGFSTEERKMMDETKKILNIPQLKITTTAIRVPTFNGHCESVTVTFKQAITKVELLEALAVQSGLQIVEKDALPHQRFVDGKDDVYVGRIRRVPYANGHSWMMWVAADNLRKGAALNGLQIAEKLFFENNISS